MLNFSPKPNLGIKAGKFGRCGKMIIKPFSISEEEKAKAIPKFMKHVKKSKDGCWEWQARIHNGYGVFSHVNGCSRWAHRVSYALFISPIKEGMHIDHKCRNRICVNPNHLKQVTPYENYKAIKRRKLREEKRLKEKMGQMTIWKFLNI